MSASSGSPSGSRGVESSLPRVAFCRLRVYAAEARKRVSAIRGTLLMPRPSPPYLIGNHRFSDRVMFILIFYYAFSIMHRLKLINKINPLSHLFNLGLGLLLR